MRYAVIEGEGANAFVENVIVADAVEQMGLEASLGKRLVDAGPLGLAIGDLHNGREWTRNVDGEQVALPLAEPIAEVDALLALFEGVTDGVEAAKLTPEQTERARKVRDAMDAALEAVEQTADAETTQKCLPIMRAAARGAVTEKLTRSL